MQAILKSTAVLFIVLIQVNSLLAQNKQSPYVPGQLIVKFKEGKTSGIHDLITELNAQVLRSISKDQMELWQVNNGDDKTDMKQLAESYENHPDIEIIEPNYLQTTSDVEEPNDPGFKEQWALQNTGKLEGSKDDADIDALEGWEIQSSSDSIVVGIIDTGVDWQHPDLINNIWQNSGEDLHGDGLLIEKNGKWIFDSKDENGKDDDGNGYIDDFIGWNFLDNNNQPFDYEAAEAGEFVQSHGTHVAGIIGATVNNSEGISGVTQKVHMALLKFLTDEDRPTGTTWQAVEAINYAVNMGMQISNNSWGGNVRTYAVYEAVRNAYKNNHLFITGAGNGGIDKIGDNISHLRYYPADHDGYTFSVANSNYADDLSITSNYSPAKVDIAAPGTHIYSCLPHNSVYYNAPYGHQSGTSMAAPFVTGACALVWQKQLDLLGTVKCQNIKQIVLDNVDIKESLVDKAVSSGRLNIHKALIAAIDTNYAYYRERDSLALVAIYNAMGGPNWEEYSKTIGEVWDIHNKPISEWGGVQLHSFGRVVELRLNFKNMSGEIPPEIGDLTELRNLRINGEGTQYYTKSRIDSEKLYTEIIEPYINQLDSFNYSGGYQNITGSIPKEIGNLKKLEQLNLSALGLTGSIPKEIGNLKRLFSLSLQGNQLTGNIPLEVFQLKKLKVLWLHLNKLNGNLPEDIKNLQYLKDLNLFYNQLDGNIPESIGSLPQLWTIDLGYNNFDGNIPTELGSFHNLSILLLDSNNLTGSIPANLSRLTIADLHIDVSSNQLSGCYDPELLKLDSIDCEDNQHCRLLNQHISDGNNFDATWEDFVNTNAGSCWASELTKVWPGDFNNDGKVSKDDVIFYGLAIGNTGLTREGPNENNNGNTNWEGQLCPDWDIKIQQINGKHQDANGDGKVDTLDYIVMIQNMGLENPDHIKATNNLIYTDNGFQLTLVPVEGSLTEFDLYLKSINGNADIYGISSTMQFNRSLQEADIDFTNSCLDALHSIKNIDLEKGIIEFALTQVDNVNITCEEVLARVLVIIIEEASSGGDGDGLLTFKADALGTLSSTHSGGDVFRPVSVTASANITASADVNLHINVVTSPQSCLGGGKATAYVSGGVAPYTYYWDSNKTTAELSGLQAGQYTLTIVDNVGTTDSLLVEIENEIIYDENGNEIECEAIIETDCPDDIDFDQNIQDGEDHIMYQGVYTANENICTSAKVLENEKVDLSAGEKVSLKPGFSMEQNSRLNIIIQNCKDE